MNVPCSQSDTGHGCRKGVVTTVARSLEPAATEASQWAECGPAASRRPPAVSPRGGPLRRGVEMGDDPLHATSHLCRLLLREQDAQRLLHQPERETQDRPEQRLHLATPGRVGERVVPRIPILPHQRDGLSLLSLSLGHDHLSAHSLPIC